MPFINELVRSLGIHSTYKGYYYIVSSLQIAINDNVSLTLFTKRIFPQVARLYSTNVACVERNIRTAIKICWCSGCRQTLLDISPYILDTPPTVGQFLDILLWNIKSRLS